ncbi:hypothetical protein ESCO_006406 [Escovopsis weberi]|uniref:Uncharacterized protein n=1 Tax=Escovopsis weberi TaxID=150374 RepID=A0A0M8MQM3_ESCWE|nr:hypothetical protein ESCO_006406 [Escovopsis weberi]
MPSSTILSGDDNSSPDPPTPKPDSADHRNAKIRTPQSSELTSAAASPKSAPPAAAAAPAAGGGGASRTRSIARKSEPTLLHDFLLGRPSAARIAAEKKRRESVEALKAELRHEMKQSQVRKLQPPNGVKARVKAWQKANAAAAADAAPDDAASEPTDVAFEEEEFKSVTEEDRIRIKMRQKKRTPKTKPPTNKSDPNLVDEDAKSRVPRKRIVSDDHWVKPKTRKVSVRKVSPRPRRAATPPRIAPHSFTFRNTPNPSVSSKVKAWAEKVEVAPPPPRSIASSVPSAESSRDDDEVSTNVDDAASRLTARQSLKTNEDYESEIRITITRAKTKHDDEGDGGDGDDDDDDDRDTCGGDGDSKSGSEKTGTGTASGTGSHAGSRDDGEDMIRVTTINESTIPESTMNESFARESWLEDSELDLKPPKLLDGDAIEVKPLSPVGSEINTPRQKRAPLLRQRSKTTSAPSSSSTILENLIKAVEEATELSRLTDDPDTYLDRSVKRRRSRSQPAAKRSSAPRSRKDSVDRESALSDDVTIYSADHPPSVMDKSVADISGEIPFGHSAFSELELPMREPSNSRSRAKQKQKKNDKNTSMRGMPNMLKKVVEEGKKMLHDMNEPPRNLAPNNPPSIEKWLSNTVDMLEAESSAAAKPFDDDLTELEPTQEPKPRRKLSQETRKSARTLSNKASSVKTVSTADVTHGSPKEDGVAIIEPRVEAKPGHPELVVSQIRREAYRSHEERQYEPEEEDLGSQHTHSVSDMTSWADDSRSGFETESSSRLPHEASRLAAPRFRPPTNGSYELSTILSDEDDGPARSEGSASDDTQSTVTRSPTVTRKTRSAGPSGGPPRRQGSSGLKRRLTKHSDLVSVLSTPDDSRVPERIRSNRSRPSLRRARRVSADVTNDDLLREFADDENLYQRELKTLVDGVIPVLLNHVMGNMTGSELFGPSAARERIESMSKAVVNMGVCLDKLKHAHKKAPGTDLRKLAHWAHGVVPIYNHYLAAWRLGFQDLIVNLAPRGDEPDDEDSLLNLLPRNEIGDLLNADGERVAVAYLLKRPLVRIKQMSKLVKCIDSIYDTPDTGDLRRDFEALQEKSRRRHREEVARLVDEEAIATDKTRARDLRTLGGAKPFTIDASRQVNAKDVFSLDLVHSNGQRLECRVELVHRDKQDDPKDDGDLLIREVGDGNRTYLLFPPVSMTLLSARAGDGDLDMVVMIRGSHNGRSWYELLTLTLSSTPQQKSKSQSLKPPVELYAGGIRRRTSSPLKHEYLPSDVSSPSMSELSPSEASFGTEGDEEGGEEERHRPRKRRDAEAEAEAEDDDNDNEEGIQYEDDEEASDLDSSEDELDSLDEIPQTELGFSIRKGIAKRHSVVASECSLTPSNSASQAGLHGHKSQPEERNRFLASISMWTETGAWRDVSSEQCSVIVSDGLVEAYAHCEEGGRPLIALDLTPLVLIRQSTSVDLEIRSTLQSHCKLAPKHPGGNFRFRCLNTPDCYNLYMMVHHARLHNRKFMQLENDSRFRSFGERRGGDQDAENGGKKRGGWFGRKNSYRSSVRAPAQSNDGVSSTPSSASANSFLRRLTLVGNFSFNLARSSVNKNSPTGSARNSIYTSNSGSSSGSGRTLPRSPSADPDSTSGEDSSPAPAPALAHGTGELRIRLHLLVSATKWEDHGNCTLQIRRPPPGWRQALRADLGLEKRITVTTIPKKKADKAVVLLDAVLGSGCFSPMGTRGIVCGIWEELRDHRGVVGKASATGPTGGNIKKWCFQFSTVGEANLVLRLVHQEVMTV